MRWVLLVLGGGLFITAVGITLDSWSTIVDLDARHRAYDKIHVGMTRRQVDEILSDEGQFRLLSWPGSKKPGSEGRLPVLPMIWECRWEDTFTTVVVQFQGDKVTKITRQPKTPPDIEGLRRSRLSLALLATIGLALLLAGLRRSPSRSPANVASTATPPA